MTATPDRPLELVPRPAAPIVHTALVAVDIRAFGDLRRDDDARLHLRHAMYELLAEAFAITLLPWRACYREDRGDGALIVVPPDVAPARLLDPLAHHLTALLRRHNRLTGELTRLRLRMAVHSGPVRHDDTGVVGHAANHLFRLLEAAALKKALDGADADLGVIVSDRFFQDTLQGGGLIDPNAYRRIRVTRKETRAPAWLWLPPRVM